MHKSPTGDSNWASEDETSDSDVSVDLPGLEQDVFWDDKQIATVSQFLNLGPMSTQYDLEFFQQCFEAHSMPEAQTKNRRLVDLYLQCTPPKYTPDQETPPPSEGSEEGNVAVNFLMEIQVLHEATEREAKRRKEMEEEQKQKAEDEQREEERRKSELLIEQKMKELNQRLAELLKTKRPIPVEESAFQPPKSEGSAPSSTAPHNLNTNMQLQEHLQQQQLHSLPMKLPVKQPRGPTTIPKPAEQTTLSNPILQQKREAALRRKIERQREREHQRQPPQIQLSPQRHLQFLQQVPQQPTRTKLQLPITKPAEQRQRLLQQSLLPQTKERGLEESQQRPLAKLGATATQPTIRLGPTLPRPATPKPPMQSNALPSRFHTLSVAPTTIPLPRMRTSAPPWAITTPTTSTLTTSTTSTTPSSTPMIPIALTNMRTTPTTAPAAGSSASVSDPTLPKAAPLQLKTINSIPRAHEKQEQTFPSDDGAEQQMEDLNLKHQETEREDKRRQEELRKEAEKQLERQKLQEEFRKQQEQEFQKQETTKKQQHRDEQKKHDDEQELFKRIFEEEEINKQQRQKEDEKRRKRYEEERQKLQEEQEIQQRRQRELRQEQERRKLQEIEKRKEDELAQEKRRAERDPKRTREQRDGRSQGHQKRRKVDGKSLVLQLEKQNTQGRQRSRSQISLLSDDEEAPQERSTQNLCIDLTQEDTENSKPSVSLGRKSEVKRSLSRSGPKLFKASTNPLTQSQY